MKKLLYLFLGYICARLFSGAQDSVTGDGSRKNESMYDQIIRYYQLEQLVNGKDKILVYDGDMCHVISWLLILREGDSMNIICSNQYPSIFFPPNKKQKFDTIQFIGRNKKLFTWAFDSLPSYSRDIYLDSISNTQTISRFISGITVVDRYDSIVFQKGEYHITADSIRSIIGSKLYKLDYIRLWYLFGREKKAKKWLPYPEDNQILKIKKSK